jgi:hypothetical protein
VENPAPNEFDERSAAEPGPRVILIATVAAFSGAVATYGFKPWGPWVGATLMVCWVILLGISATAQNHRDRASGRLLASPETRRVSILERILRSLVFLGAAACFAYGHWLERHGASQADVQPFYDGVLLLMVLGYVADLTVQTIFAWLDRRKNAAPGV